MAKDISKLPRIAVACAALGFPLLLLSYSWIPVAKAGREMGSLNLLPPMGEIGALLSGMAGIGLGYKARRNAPCGTSARRVATLALALSVVLMALTVVPNIVAVLLVDR